MCSERGAATGATYLGWGRGLSFDLAGKALEHKKQWFLKSSPHFSKGHHAYLIVARRPGTDLGHGWARALPELRGGLLQRGGLLRARVRRKLTEDL
jgi:hypothetical protein